MAEWRTFRNAPIAEALLDIRAKPARGIGRAKLAEFQRYVKDRYPARRERSFWQGALQFGPEGVSASSRKDESHEGYLFISGDGKQIVQARLDGFTFSRLRPYDSWATFSAEAKDLWSIYCRVAEPEEASRLALRFINRIELPLTTRDFKEYVLTTPEIAPGLPQGLLNFFLRLELPMEGLDCLAIVTETMEPPDKTVPLILDLDVIREAPVKTDSTELWDTFERLRVAKNELFFKSITAKAEELFQ